jgi:hypothetical protein
MTMDNVSKDPEIPASHAEAEEALRMPPGHWGPRYPDEGIAERRPRLWTHLKAWFGRSAEARQLRLERDGPRRPPVHPTPLNPSPPPDTLGESARAGRLARLRVVSFIP